MRCSNPGCKLPTSGPQDEDRKVISIGVAAHITAASSGGPRYDPTLSSNQRRSIGNGIWLCQSCSKLIDNDPIRYTKEMLLEWKNSAEDFARSAIESPSRNYETQIKPIDRLKIYIKDKSNWKSYIGEEQNRVFYYDQFPEFTIIENHNFCESYDEPWTTQFPDKNSNQLEYFAKYHETIITKIYLVCCDGGRFLTAEPQRWLYDSPSAYYYTYFFVINSIEYLTEEMITTAEHPNNCRAPSVYEEFGIFESEEDAYKSIECDFNNGMHKYTYYSFDKKESRYSKVRNK
jgi:hypothetical protein